MILNRIANELRKTERKLAVATNGQASIFGRTAEQREQRIKELKEAIGYAKDEALKQQRRQRRAGIMQEANGDIDKIVELKKQLYSDEEKQELLKQEHTIFLVNAPDTFKTLWVCYNDDERNIIKQYRQFTPQ